MASRREAIIGVCHEAIGVAEQLQNDDAKAYLMAQKARALLVEVSFLIYRKRNLVLAQGRGWISFALEAEQREYERLANSIAAYEREADRLLAEALRTTERISSLNTKAHVLMSMGQAYGGKYLDYKLDHLKNSKVLSFFGHGPLGDYFAYGRRDRRVLKEYLARCEWCFLEAVALFDATRDEGNKAYAYYNLANMLRSAHRFRKARRYLVQARAIAEKLGDVALVTLIKQLEKSIRTRDRNILDNRNME